MWLFGGNGWDNATGISDGSHNDLWKYDRSSGNWTWMKGSAAINQNGTYGTRLSSAPQNNPGSRAFAASWTDSSGAFWLFGGLGYASTGGIGYLNDLWKFEPSTGNWTWMRGSMNTGQAGISSGIRLTSTFDTPGARHKAASWMDASGVLWLFGGYGADTNGSQNVLNDLWKFNPATGNWTWMNGSQLACTLGVYGQRGVAAADNTPGARYGSSTWVDPSGKAWLFGGHAVTAGTEGPQMTDLSDMWKYDPASGNWAWMGGITDGWHNQNGVYGTLGVPSPDNIPGVRNSAVSWTDSSGALWLFGGYGEDYMVSVSCLSDLWRYDRATGEWTWCDGPQYNKCGVFATTGTPSPDNLPGSRSSAVSWIDSADSLWLFGGEGLDATCGRGPLNDLWHCLDTAAPTGTIQINNNRSVTNNASVTLSLNCSDGPGYGVARMKFCNDGGTWTAWEPLATTKPWTLPAGEGYKTVRAMFRDRAGNNSIICSDYIRVDTTPPTGSIIINAGATSTKSRVVSLGLTWNDGTGSGVRRMRFSIDGATWSCWEPQCTPKSYTLPAAPGYYTVRVQYLDAGNNYSPVYNDYIKLLAP
jgi:N-acetylneuraminic acid mutarotase